MTAFLFVILIYAIPLFAWPLYHAIVGPSPKEKVLRKVFFTAIIGESLIAILSYFTSGHDRTEGFIVLTELFAIVTSVMTILVLIFKREHKQTNGAS